MVDEKNDLDKQFFDDVELKRKFLSAFGFSVGAFSDFSKISVSSFKQLVLFKRLFEKVFIKNCSSFKKYWAVNSYEDVYFKNSKVNFDLFIELLDKYKDLFFNFGYEDFSIYQCIVISVPINKDDFVTSVRNLSIDVVSSSSWRNGLFSQDFVNDFKDRLVVSNSKVNSLSVVANNPLVKDFLGGGNHVSWSGCPIIKKYLDQPVSAGFRFFDSGVLVVKTARLYKACLFQKNFWGMFLLKEVSVGEAVSLINKLKVSEKELYLVKEVESKLNQYSLLKNI